MTHVSFINDDKTVVFEHENYLELWDWQSKTRLFFKIVPDPQCLLVYETTTFQPLLRADGYQSG